jgi:hypothetical protein
VTSPLPDAPLANDGGLAAPAGRAGIPDAYAQLNDLMVVIEALSPTWPPRAVEPDPGPFLL